MKKNIFLKSIFIAIINIFAYENLSIAQTQLSKGNLSAKPQSTENRTTSTASIRITCDGNDVDATVKINGVFKGTCPVDIAVPHGTLQVFASKPVDQAHERVFKQELQIAAGTVKRIEIILGDSQLSAAGRSAEENRKTKQLELEKAEIKKTALLDAQSNAGNASSMVELAKRYATGIGTPINTGLSVSWYLRAAEAGNIDAMAEAAFAYEKGIGTEKNIEKAFNYYRQSAEASNPSGMAGLGGMFFNGTGTSKNYFEAAKWWTLAEKFNAPRAITGLGALYYMGDGGFIKSWDTAANYFRKAIALNYLPAKNWLAALSYEDYANPLSAENNAASISALKDLAESGNPNEMVAYGFYLSTKLGKNSEALYWYRRAAELGDDNAMYNIGFYYEEGLGGLGKNKFSALSWYQKSAALGNKKALRGIKRVD